MKEHFVESRLGGYHFSYDDTESIQQYDEITGDSDAVLFTFDDEDKKEPFKSLASYLTSGLIFKKKDFVAKLLGYDALNIGIKAAIQNIKNDIVYEIDTSKDIVKSLYENKEIDKKTYDKLMKYFDKIIKKQFEYIDNFDYLKKEKEKQKKR